jgi:hypothetical protein
MGSYFYIPYLEDPVPNPSLLPVDHQIYVFFCGQPLPTRVSERSGRDAAPGRIQNIHPAEI